jgi:hypothetical protein
MLSLAADRRIAPMSHIQYRRYYRSARGLAGGAKPFCASTAGSAPIGALAAHDSAVMIAILIVGIVSSLRMSANSYRPIYIVLYSKRTFISGHSSVR